MAARGGLSEPFVLTLEIDGEAFAAFDRLRRTHYPPDRNHVPAHITVFHQLPAERGRDIKAILKAESARQRPIDIAVGAPKSIGNGVAFFLDSPQLSALRDRLAREWRPWMTEQDAGRFRPHVTVQNKVAPPDADRLVRKLRAEPAPRTIRGVGLHLWRYMGGPWESVQLFRFG